MSEQKKQYRSWTAEQKIAIVLAGLRGDRSVKEVCREHQISDTLFYSWRDKLLEGVWVPEIRFASAWSRFGL